MRILWDLDGTIVDTIPSLTETFCSFVEKYHGIKVDWNIANKLTKVNSEELFAYYNIPYSDENVNKFREVNRSIPVSKTPLFEGVVEVLSKSELNILVTNRNRKSTIEILTHWNIIDYFKEIICVDDGFPRKPDSTSYRYVHKKYDVELVVGDRELDLTPGREIGLRTCLYRNPSVKADFHINDYAEFSNIVR